MLRSTRHRSNIKSFACVATALGALAAASAGCDSTAVSGAGGAPAPGTGGGGKGGASGAGAVGCTDPEPGVLDLVDDMEDGDAGIEVREGRNGYWYSGNDGSGGTMVPASGTFAMAELSGSDPSAFAAGLKASGFKDWGSVIGFNFVEQASLVKAYDGSAYCGVRFWGKAAATTTVSVRVPDGDTHPNGNVCKETGAANQLCYDHFVAKIAFTTSWKEHSVKFSDLKQFGTGYHPADGKLKADKLYALEWALPGMNQSYEIWVDDVSFIECQ